MAIGFHVECIKCGTDSPDRVYYVGPIDCHCGDCWLVMFNRILNAQVRFPMSPEETPIGDELQEDTIEIVYNSGGSS